MVNVLRFLIAGISFFCGMSVFSMTMEECVRELKTLGLFENLEHLETELPKFSAQIIQKPEDAELLGRFGMNNPATRLALKINIETTQHKFRKGGVPYPDHPVRLALLLHEILKNIWSSEEIQAAQQYALTHDSLEEGEGLSLKSILNIHKKYSKIEDFMRSAIILTEPELDYKTYDPVYETYHKIEKLAVLLQTRLWAERYPELAKPMIAAIISDKLINLFDDGYLSKELSQTEREYKLVLQISAILYAYEILRPTVLSLKDASGGLNRLHQMLLLGVRYKIAKYSLNSQLVEDAKLKVYDLERTHLSRLTQEIAGHLEEYHQAVPELKLGISRP